jgi:hypothetical protein
MDPDKALADLRDALQRYRAAESANNLTAATAAAHDLAGSVEALDAWLSAGGFLPRDWMRS